jgi:hypothetical protein
MIDHKREIERLTEKDQFTRASAEDWMDLCNKQDWFLNFFFTFGVIVIFLQAYFCLGSILEFWPTILEYVGIVDPRDTIVDFENTAKTLLWLGRHQTAPLVMAWPIAIGFQIGLLAFVRAYNARQQILWMWAVANQMNFERENTRNKEQEQSETNDEDTNGLSWR